jgi:hypothetical protein
VVIAIIVLGIIALLLRVARHVAKKVFRTANRGKRVSKEVEVTKTRALWLEWVVAGAQESETVGKERVCKHGGSRTYRLLQLDHYWVNAGCHVNVKLSEALNSTSRS